MNSVFYWIGVAAVGLSALIVFGACMFTLIGWLLYKSGIKKYSDLGESFVNFVLVRGAIDVVKSNHHEAPEKP